MKLSFPLETNLEFIANIADLSIALVSKRLISLFLLNIDYRTMVESLQKTSRSDNYDLNFKLQMIEIRQYERKLWKNNRFCQCGADCIEDCSCEAEKQRRFRKRRKRKVNEKFSSELNNLMSGKLPKS